MSVKSIDDITPEEWNKRRSNDVKSSDEAVVEEEAHRTDANRTDRGEKPPHDNQGGSEAIA